MTDVLDVLGQFGMDCGDPNTAPDNCPDTPCCDADACGTGTVWNPELAQCISNLAICPGDVDYDGIVGVNDVLDILSNFGAACQ